MMAQTQEATRDSMGAGAALPEWAEDCPSYFTQIQALLAELTEADKDAVHASLQEE